MRRGFIDTFCVIVRSDQTRYRFNPLLSPVRFTSPHFPAFPEFNNTSYASRYEIFCKKLVQEQLYDAAALLLTKKSDINTGNFSFKSEFTNPKRFAIALASKVLGISYES